MLNWLRVEDGATVVEYGILASLLAIACIIAAGSIGGESNDLFQRIGEELERVGLSSGVKN